MIPERIETQRLVLRPWAFEDVGDVLAYAVDEEYGRFLPLPRPYRDDDARKFIATQVLADRNERPSLAIEYEGAVLGGIGIRISAGGRVAEMGYSIARSHWRRGFATEAARAVVSSAFQGCTDLLKLRAMADARNLASIRVVEKLGMRREGVLRSNRFVHGEAIDEVWYGLLRDEWTA